MDFATHTTDKTMKTRVKKNRLFPICCLLCVCITITGCEKVGIKRKLSIAMMSYFDKDFVEIKLDDALVFSDTISTSGLSSNSSEVSLNYPIGKYNLTITINGKEVSEKFRHKIKGTYIEIGYSKTNSLITVSYPDKPSIIEG